MSLIRIFRRLCILFLLIILSLAGKPENITNDSLTAKVSVTVFLKAKNSTPDLNSITIPLKRAGRLFLIEAQIDGENGNLIFDTGASGLVLNRTYFRSYTGLAKLSGGGISGSTGKITSITVGDINVSGLQYENAEADLADLGHIEDKRGIKILGLFGISMLSDLEVVFNAAENELRFTRIDKNGNYISPNTPQAKYDHINEMVTNHSVMIIKGTISDKDLSFCLDTGAEINVIHYALPKKVLSTVEITRQSDVGGAGAGTAKALYGVMNDFRFCNYKFAKMDAAIINLSGMSEAYGCTIDGMLGYDFWQQGEFCFNFRKRQISFNIRKGDGK